MRIVKFVVRVGRARPFTVKARVSEKTYALMQHRTRGRKRN